MGAVIALDTLLAAQSLWRAGRAATMFDGLRTTSRGFH